MNTTHRRSRGTRAPARRALLVVAALGAATTLSLPVIAQGPPGLAGVLLAGPTGVRSGTPVVEGGAPPDAAAIPPFDTYGRDPALRLASADPDAGFSLWSVSAAPTDGGTDPVTLVAGVAEVPVETVAVPAPPPGDWLVVAEVTSNTASLTGAWAWHLVVPDRSLPDDLPAPDIVLFGGGETVIAERGSGCFLGTCGDIGGLPPDRALPGIRLDRPDEPIAVTLSDGSGIVWLGASAVRLDGDATEPAVLAAGDPFPATNVVQVPPPPTSGRWRLEITLTYADGRGDGTGYARVAVP